MKRLFTALLMVLGCCLTTWAAAEVIDELTYTIDNETCTLYRDGTTATTTSFAKLLKSNNEPTLQLSTTANNMKWTDGNVTIYTGASGSCTYTLTAPGGYVIDSFSMVAKQASDNDLTDMTLTIGEAIYNTASGPTIEGKRVGTSTMTIVQKGGNKGVVLKNFSVTLREDKPERPVVSTAEETVWYYIVNATTTATYCQDKVMYADVDNGGKMRWGDRLFNPNYVWSFWEKDGKIAIRNYAGQYIGTAGSGTGNSTQFCTQATANYSYTIDEAYGAFTIKDAGVELHAQSSQQVIVRWGAEEGNASLWKFQEVDCSRPEATVASTVVQQGRVTTGIGNKNVPILRTTINVSGLMGTVPLRGISGKISGTGSSRVEKVKVYVADNERELFIDEDKTMTWREENGRKIGDATIDGKTYSLTLDEDYQLPLGVNYLWIVYDISDEAKEGEKVDATIAAYNIGGETLTEKNGNPTTLATIFLSEGSVLMPRDNGSTYYRIPAITQIEKDGKTRLVTLTDDRREHGSDLPSHCYVVAQYSDDLGRTWTAPKTVAGTVFKGGDYGHGDASLVTNRDNGDIIGIMTSAGTYGHGFFSGTADEPLRWKTITSHDGGETWTSPKDFTNSLYGSKCTDAARKTWKSGFSGSGAALQKRDGTLVSSFVNREADNSQHFYFFMSKDGGKSWYVSGTSGMTPADEPKTLERNNGDLAISVRTSGYNYHNVTSDDGATWKYADGTRFTSGISGNACDGEYMVWCAKKEGNYVGKTASGDSICDIAFQTLPNNASRQNLSIALSTDEGETFETPKTICPRGSAYSAAVVLPDGTVGVYYEENGLFGGYTMRFVRFSLNWASSGKYDFSEEHPFKPIASTNTETGIQQTATKAAPKGVYDLQGRRLKALPAKAGIYVVDGKKVAN